MEAALGVFPLGYRPFWLLTWCGALLVACVALAATRLGPVRSLGLGLMTVPLWTTLWGFLNSIPDLTDPTSFRPPASPQRLSLLYWRSILVNLGYLGAGFLLWAVPVRELGRLRMGGVARRLAEAGLPMGGRSEGRSAFLGLLGFPLLLAGALTSAWLFTRTLPQTGDATQFWVNMTPYHAIMISAAAAVTEELVYRGFLMVVLWRGLSRWLGERGAAWTAVGVQAVVFALAHGGYGTLENMLMPLAFGLVAGWVALRFGIWAAIVLHFLIDVLVFASYTVETYPWFAELVAMFLLVNVAATLGWLVWRAVRRFRGGRRGGAGTRIAGPRGGA